MDMSSSVSTVYTQEENNTSKSSQSLYIVLLVLAFVVSIVVAFVVLQKENKDKDPNDPSYKSTGQLVGQSIGLGVAGVICLLVFVFIVSNIGPIIIGGGTLLTEIFGAIFKLIGAIFDGILSLF